jgi:uncharacterized protein
MDAASRYAKPVAEPLPDRVAGLDWAGIAAALDEHGHATTPALLSDDECRALTALYPQEAPFRSRVVMQRHGFGRGEYKYFRNPLPPVVEELRRAIYPLLAPTANRWRELLNDATRVPPDLDGFLAQCHAAGQKRPTPLLLKYETGDFNCLHQDLYGELVFPLQMTILLDEPGRDFSGGEFLIVEQRPRAQSKGEVISLRRGEAVIFAVHHRPVQGTRGAYRVNLRHGVSRLRSGQRHSLGIIFHDAA